MAYRVPSADELRSRAQAQGIEPTDDDLERVVAFMQVLLPQIEELERLVPRDTAPATLFRPELEG